MKKFLTVALLTLYAMSAQSRESITIGDYLFTYSPAESNAWARNYVGNDSHAVVPSSISFMTEMRDSHGYVIYDDDGKPRKIFHHYDVTEAFCTFIRKNVTEVILPNSIKRTWMTFNECTSLKSVDLGCVEVIDGSTFWKCTSLASIEIPSTVKIIGDNAFNSCSSLSSIIIPSSVTNIGYDAFIYCDALTSIETPSSLKFLGSGSFRYCASLKSAEINGTDLAVEVGTFLECPNLETAILGSGITSIADGSTTSGYETGMFAYCTSLKSVAINTTSVMKLPIAMFYRSSVQTVSVAGGFAEIGKGAFYRCTSLEAIEGNLVPITIGDNAFYKCSKFKSGVDFSRCEAISGWAFYECSSLTNVRFGPNLSSIGSNAFYGCSKLELVEFDGAPPSVGSGAFSRVKSGAVGTYTAEHAAEWDAVIDADGKWNGLIMKQLEPPAPPTLSVESADWTDGTITLRCEDANLNGAAVPFYNLMYYDTAEAKWRVIDRYDMTIPTPVEETNGSGGKTTVTRITDKYFSKRNNGVGTVKYRVVDEADSSRVAGCETRKRYGLFVAVGEYEDTSLSPLPMVKHECAVFKDAYVRYGEGAGICWTEDSRPTRFEVLGLLSAMKEKVLPGDIFLFYFYGHGGTGYLCCYDKDGKITNSDLKEYFKDFCDGAGMVAVIYCCHSASMFLQDNDSMNLGRVGWILSSQADELTWAYSVTSIICNDGWFNGKADVLNGEYGFGNGDGYVTFAELAEYGLDWTIKNEYYGHRQQMKPANTFILSNIVAGKIPSSNTSDRKWKWLTRFASLFSSANGDVVAAETMPAANGCRTVGECYALGIDPEDPNDDLKITDFKMKDGKPVIQLNHTEDGSGNSFLPRVKTLGKSDLSDATEEWREVPKGGDPAMRFFKVSVEMP